MSRPSDETLGKLQDWRLVGRLVLLLRAHWMAVALCTLSALGSTALQILGPLLISVAVDSYLTKPYIAIRRYPWLPQDFRHGLIILSVAYLFSLIGTCVLDVLQSYLAQWTGQKAMASLRDRVFKQLQTHPLSFFDANPVGRLVTRLTTDIEALNELFSNGIISILVSLLMMVFFLVSMVALNARLSLLLGLILPVFVVLTIIFRRATTGSQQRVRIALARINAFIAEQVEGINVLLLFNLQPLSCSSFAKINDEHLRASKGWVVANAWFLPLVELLGTISQAGLLGVGALLVNEGQLTLGLLVAFLQYGARFLRPIQDISERYATLQSSVVSAERVFALLDLKPERAAVPEGAAGLILNHPDIEFRNVWFAYNEDDWVLRDISFRVPAGSSLAIVGHTGSGKTTIASLLLRFYEPQQGSIHVGGVDIRLLSQEQLRRNFGAVLQDTFVKEGSILDNIRLGEEDLGSPVVSREGAIEAARESRLSDSLMALPDGRDTIVAERGDNLSTGQKQLISFARAISRKPQLLILDEATSAIDTETERRIQEAMGSILGGRTSIIIAHRLATVLHADQIILLHEGEVREMGTHAELLALRGVYWRLVKLQFAQNGTSSETTTRLSGPPEDWQPAGAECAESIVGRS